MNEIKFSEKEILEIKSKIVDLILNVAGMKIPLVFQGKDGHLPIMPQSASYMASSSIISKGSWTQWKHNFSPAMVTIDIEDKFMEPSYPINLFLSLLHERGHCITYHNVKLKDDGRDFDRKDCELKAVQSQKEYIEQYFDKTLANKLLEYWKKSWFEKLGDYEYAFKLLTGETIENLS